MRMLAPWPYPPTTMTHAARCARQWISRTDMPACATCMVGWEWMGCTHAMVALIVEAVAGPSADLAVGRAAPVAAPDCGRIGRIAQLVAQRWI